MPNAPVERSWRQAAIDENARGRESRRRNQYDHIGFWIVDVARLDDDECSREPGAQLTQFVSVRVIDERAAARRREARLEGIARLDNWRNLRCIAAKARNSIEIAFQLDAVPMHGRWFWQLIHDGDPHRLAALQDDGRSWQKARAGNG